MEEGGEKSREIKDKREQKREKDNQNMFVAFGSKACMSTNTRHFCFSIVFFNLDFLLVYAHMHTETHILKSSNRYAHTNI